MVNVWQSVERAEANHKWAVMDSVMVGWTFKAIAIAWLVCLKDVALLALQEHGRRMVLNWQLRHALGNGHWEDLAEWWVTASLVWPMTTIEIVVRPMTNSAAPTGPTGWFSRSSQLWEGTVMFRKFLMQWPAIYIGETGSLTHSTMATCKNPERKHWLWAYLLACDTFFCIECRFNLNSKSQINFVVETAHSYVFSNHCAVSFQTSFCEWGGVWFSRLISLVFLCWCWCCKLAKEFMDGMQFEMVMLHGGMKACGAEKNGGERERVCVCVCVCECHVIIHLFA